MRSAIAIALVLLSLSVSLAMTPQPVTAAQTWTVLVGGGTKGTAVVSNSFSPRTIEIALGDTVTWVFQQPFPLHTVTFMSGEKPPEVIVPEGDKMYANPQVFFPAGGKTYDGTVIVKERVSASPASTLARGRSELAATLKAGQASFARWNPERKGNEVFLSLVGNPKEGWSNFRFSREPLVIKRGTTVTWTGHDPFEIHTVTFTSGQNPPEFIVIEPQQQGPPRLLLNPKAGTPSKTKTYDGTGYVNSGILFPPGTPGNPPNSFSLTFTKAGRHEYFCVIHAPWGMKGTIIVQ